MKEYIVRVQQTKEYVFTMAAEDGWDVCFPSGRARRSPRARFYET